MKINLSENAKHCQSKIILEYNNNAKIFLHLGKTSYNGFLGPLKSLVKCSFKIGISNPMSKTKINVIRTAPTEPIDFAEGR